MLDSEQCTILYRGELRLQCESNGCIQIGLPDVNFSTSGAGGDSLP